MNKSQPKFIKEKYAPQYQNFFFDLPWYEKDLLIYYTWPDYKDMDDDPDHYLNNLKVVNFDIIHHESRGDPLKKSCKVHKTIVNEDFENYSKKD